MPSTTPPPADLPTRECPVPDGRTLGYTVAGDPDGVPVVAHHGTPGSRLFAALLDGAAERTGVRVVVPDRPGYGRSDPPPSGWTWSDWSADHDALLDAVEVDRAAVLGFSGGGPFALAAAASDRTTRVGLVSALAPPAEGGLAALARLPILPRALFRLTDAAARVVGPRVVVGQYTDRSVPDPVAAAVAADFHEAFRRGAGATVREFRAAATGQVDEPPRSVPIRAWHGTRDDNTPLGPLRALVERADGSVVTGDGDHLGTLLDRRRDALAWLASA